MIYCYYLIAMASEKTKKHTFDNVSSLEAVIAGLDPASLKSIHTGEAFDKEGSRAEVPEDIDLSQIDQEAISDQMAVVNDRTGAVASIVSTQYHKLDHSQAFNPLVEAIKDLGVSVEGRVREHKNGNRVIIEAQFSDTELEIDNDSSYLLGFHGINTYDKSSGFALRPYGKRLVCSNGLMLEGVLSVGTVNRIHIGEMDVVEQYKDYLQNLLDLSEEFRELVMDARDEWLENVPVVLENVGIPEGRVDDVMDHLQLQDTSEVSRHQLWNAVTSYVTHELQGDVAIATERRYQKSGLRVLQKPKQELEREPEVEQ